MRRKILGAGLVRSLVAGGVVAGDGSAQQQPSTIELVTEHLGGFRVDNRPRGASPGDGWASATR